MLNDDDETSWDADEETQVRNVADEHPLARSASYRPLIDAVATEVRRTEPGDQIWRLTDGLGVIETMMRAVNRDGWKVMEEDYAESIICWRHQNHIKLAGKVRLEPYILIEETQESAAIYLNLPYRVPALDRILVDMLIASELLSFVDEIQPIISKKIPLLLGWILNNVLSIVVGFSFAAFCFWIGGGSTVMNWIGGISLGMTILGTAWSLVAYPFYYPKVRAHHLKVEGTISAMLDAYAALAGRPASIKHIDAMLAKATDKGAVWPSQLFVLMEDISLRSATI